MLAIQKLFINYNFSNRSEKIKYIVVHDVGAHSTARNNRDYFAGGNRDASADFFIDSTNIIQTIDYNQHYSWAIGDGAGKYGKTNGNSVSMEMCLEANLKPSTSTVNNTIDLVKYLMKALNISADNVVRHYDCSHKNCPGSFSANNWSAWTDFKKQLASQPVTPIVAATPVIFHKNIRVTVQTPLIGSGGECIKTYKVNDIFTAINEDSSWWKLAVGKLSKVHCAEVIVTPVAPVVTPVTDTTYRVVTGSFTDKANADKRVAELKKVGVQSFVVKK